ncbi:uncharacterized protein MELLADRAFT_64005 [Melampsora larici-populina 98AG31]|uniref:Uncharacterized protein n=1 Tax=Melampsora larici-populina (strain 98AG31 / pathotype 3-4-7) TaxID=747676 RepID=F4RPU0_MELLP|nr:uncharacterized protein MELLADRAFT_64005 [Melampsora larici-populina 98AG31]EGG05679.1 hypothetical protein MELLADRAFT_64005 [Melampsora larici-populina 98AG31]
MQTREEQKNLLRLPQTIVLAETKAHDLAQELGTKLLAARDGNKTALIALQIAKSNLYEAKVGLVEQQRRAHLHTGTTDQAYNNQQHNKKKNLPQKKYRTYHRHVLKYNSQPRRRRRDMLCDPTYEELLSMAVTDGFWDLGGLSHPDEEWASNDHTREGIQLYLLLRAAKEEIKRIARETCQLIWWALEYQVKIDDVRRKLLLTEDYFLLMDDVGYWVGRRAEMDSRVL